MTKYYISGKNEQAYNQTKGVATLDFFGHGKQIGHDQMSPVISYWDSLGRRITYGGYDLYSLLKQINKEDLKKEGVKILRQGRKCSIGILEKVALKLNLKTKIKDYRN